MSNTFGLDQSFTPDARRADIGEYEAKFEATSRLLEAAERNNSILDKKFGILRQEIEQVLKDYTMWITAHGSDYPLRRRAEILGKLEEINNIK